MEYRVRSLSPQRKTLSRYFAPRLCLGRLIQGGHNVDSTCEIWPILAFVLEALLVGLVGKPMVLELGRHTAFTPFPWWWPGAKSLAEILSDRREHNTKPRWCSSMCREMHCLRLPPHNIDTCTYQCRWIWYQYVFNVIIVMIMNVLSASKDALEVILVSQSRDSLPHSLSRLVQVVQSWQAACKDFFHFWGLKLWGIPGIRSMGPSVSYC